MSSNSRGIVLIGLGASLIMAGILLGGYNLWDEQRAETSAQAALEQLNHVVPVPEAAPAELQLDPEEIEVPDYLLNPEMEMPVQQLDGIPYIGVLSIPALEIEMPIVSQWSDALSRTAPCRYYGSVYQNNMVVAGHNYRNHFGRLSKISIGDHITFVDMDGNVFEYEVVDVEVLQPNQIEAMCDEQWDLTLFTCTLDGQKRLTVRCEVIERDAVQY